MLFESPAFEDQDYIPLKLRHEEKRRITRAIVERATERYLAKGGAIDRSPPVYEKPQKRRKDMTAKERRAPVALKSLTDDTQVYQENEDADT